MLTKITIRNFKRFDEIEIELGDPVVFIGPNNSGKTSVLQALALWETGLRKWSEKRKDKKTPEKRPGVTINRRDLISVPCPSANLLWRDLHVRDVKKGNGKQITKNVLVDVIVEGITNGSNWKCGLEFDYSNEESFFCRPIRSIHDSEQERMPIPSEAKEVRMAFLPPMSGLAANETRLDPGAVNVRIGEGRTAEVVRNLCYSICSSDKPLWEKLRDQILALFGVRLDAPQYVSERGEIDLTYVEINGTRLDLSSSGRGLQQTILLLSYMYANPGAILLLDEPDAHLEILRQRQIYQLLTDVAHATNGQIIAASHSEVLLNEAADRDVVIAFIGKHPHRINDHGSQVLKALRDIGFEDYYLAEQTGWVLYLEGSTDLAILRSFAEKLGHKEASTALERPFVHYVSNKPVSVQQHYFGLKEAVPHLKGVAIFDRLDMGIPENPGIEFEIWQRREIENYLCNRRTLEAYARGAGQAAAAGPLFEESEVEPRLRAMHEAIEKMESSLSNLGKPSPWGSELKVSDDFLTPLFTDYFKRLGVYNIMAKKNFHELARFVPTEEIAPEVREKLDAIAATMKAAEPAGL